MHKFFDRNITLKIFSIFLYSSTYVNSSAESVHYKFNVGQGECSITTSTFTQGDESFKVAVIADIGSSSFRTDPKYNFDENSMSAVFQRINKKDKTGLSLINLDEEINTSNQNSNSQPNSREISAGNTSTETMKGHSSVQLKVFDSIYNRLENSLYWFVILSHPDKDHINGLKGIMDRIHMEPENLDHIKRPKCILLILGGEWFNSDSTEEILEVLALIQQYNDIIVPFFPYEVSKPSGKEIMMEVLMGPPIDKRIRTSFNPKREVNGIDLEKFQGNLTTCIKNIFDHIYVPKQKKEEGATSPPPLLTESIQEKYNRLIYDKHKQLIEDFVTNKIYFWSLDCRPVNTNGQSLVWSYCVDNIGWTFVFTGDAEPSTFKKIREYLCYESLEDHLTSCLNRDNNLVMMQGMHHGSKENFSQEALDIFKPDALFFSAGNGASFAHPSYDAIKKYKKISSSRFWEKYQHLIDYYFISFDEKGLGEGKVVKAKKEGPLLMGTNSYGTTIFEKDQIRAARTCEEGYIVYDRQHIGELNNREEHFPDSFSLSSDKLKKLKLPKLEKDELIKIKFKIDSDGDSPHYVSESTDKKYKLKIVEILEVTKSSKNNVGDYKHKKSNANIEPKVAGKKSSSGASSEKHKQYYLYLMKKAETIPLQAEDTDVRC